MPSTSQNISLFEAPHDVDREVTVPAIFLDEKASLQMFNDLPSQGLGACERA